MQVMEGAMGSATTTTTPADQVDDLIKAVADEAGLEISTQLASVPTGNGIGTMFKSYTFIYFSYCEFSYLCLYCIFIALGTIGESTAQSVSAADDPLGRRLAALRE